jgi:large subunit ribosomal protein L27
MSVGLLNGLFVLQVKMGRDHTIYAITPGFVRFYREKHLSGQRKFVGLVLNRGEKLPRDEVTLGRSRYFGLVDLNRPPPQSTLS